MSRSSFISFEGDDETAVITEVTTDDEEGVTSKILSAMIANLSISTLSLVDANINCALVGKRLRKSCFKMLSSNTFSPNNCLILLSNWEGFLSPNSSEMSNLVQTLLFRS